MKTRYFSIFGAFLAMFVLLCANTELFAQKLAPRSDTVSLTQVGQSDSSTILRDFGSGSAPIVAGTTVCHTIYFQNKTSGIVVIQGLNPSDGFAATAIPPLPVVLLQNEIVSLADLCFTGGNSTVPTVEGYLRIGYLVGQTGYTLFCGVTGFQIADSLLNKPCITTSLDNSIFGPIIMDGDVSHTLTFTSNRHQPIMIREYGDSIDAAFHLTGITLPYTLAPLEVKTFNITFSPRSNVPSVKYRFFSTMRFYADNCTEPYFDLVGIAIPPTDPATPTNLAAGSSDVLAMISDNSVTTQTFNFKNSGTTNLKITGVALKNNTSFAITNITPSNTLPFILTPGQSMAVTVSMTSVVNGVYYDEVIITAEQGIISMDFPLQGLRKNGVQAAVHNAISSSNVTIYPNPSRGDILVAMPGIRNANIEVLDVLGKVVITATASETWNWKSTVPAGTYLLHVSGADEQGRAFQSYDRFIIRK